MNAVPEPQRHPVRLFSARSFAPHRPASMEAERVETAGRGGFLAGLRRAGTPVRPEFVSLDEDAAVTYAIGDVHGCLDELLRLEDMIFEDAVRVPGPKRVVMLGDYVDRGRDSAAVIAHLRRAMPEGFERLCLRGNHEAMMLAFLDDARRHLPWLRAGGTETLASYGVDTARLLRLGQKSDDIRRALHEALPVADIHFIRNLPVAATLRHLFFVHAGIRPGLALRMQTEQDMLWIREPFLSEGPRLPLTVIHGHTPGEKPVRLNGRICVDTGACYTGRLTALRIAADRGSFLSTH